MLEANSPPVDRSRRTFARWNEIESLTASLATQTLQGLVQHSEQYLATVKTMTATKQQLRELIIMVSQEASSAVTEPHPPVALSEVKTLLAQFESGLDSMNEMSEETFLRLQMMMDRRSKFISALSNIMKKVSDTQDALVQNLK